ncbi:PIG-L family deacetylase [Deinococcus aluminii]|uniref:PLL-like beta propeller domain-containing protein n=1 Tax=Deinococcus aluminii TaxID=1656885 RepID=A0ABP9XA50_9DEIO
MSRLRLLAAPLAVALLLASCNNPSSNVPADASKGTSTDSLAPYMPPDSTSNFEITSLPLIQSLSFAPDLCNDAQDVYVVAHEDDDLLFMNPDISNVVRQNHCVVTVFLTAGDNEYGTQQVGIDYQQYWRDRESGERAAYARMAGVANTWTEQIYTFAGKAIRTSVLQANPRVRLMFLRLRESNSSGVTMRKLWEGPDGQVGTALDNSNTFTRQEVLNVLNNVLTVSEAKYVHIQDTNPISYSGAGDHADHTAAALFGQAADKTYPAPHVLIQHRDYNSNDEPNNLSSDQTADKVATFKTYAAFDPFICYPQTGTDCIAPGNFHYDWSMRQYFHIDPTQGGSVVRLPDGRLATFVVGDRSSSLRKTVQAAPGSSSWNAWDDLKGNFAALPTVTSMADGRLAAFIRRNDGKVAVTTEVSSGGAWNDWVSLGGVVSSTPAAARQADGKLSVFVRGNDGQIYVKTQLTPNGSWGGWAGVWGPKFASNPAAMLDRFGCLVLFARGADGAIYTVAQTAPNGGWGSWKSLGGAFGSDAQPVPGRDQDGRLEVFVRGTDGKLYQRWQTFSGGWGGWSRLYDVQFTQSPVVASNTDGTLEVFVRSVSGSVMSVKQTSPNSGWQPWTDFGGSFTTVIGAVPDATGRLTAIARGTDDRLYQKVQGDVTWSAFLTP